MIKGCLGCLFYVYAFILILAAIGLLIGVVISFIYGGFFAALIELGYTLLISMPFWIPFLIIVFIRHNSTDGCGSGYEDDGY